MGILIHLPYFCIYYAALTFIKFVKHWLVFQDHNTIMRSWAVKDFCPDTNQFIQLFRTENKIHVKFAG